MDEIPSVIPKAILEVISRLENDGDNRYTWKLTRNLDSLSFTVNCKFRAKTCNKAKDDSEVTRRVAVKPVKRRRKKNSPSALARSKRRLERFLEKKSAGKPDVASPGETGTPVSPQQDSVILQDSLTCGSVRDLTFSDQPTSVENPQAEADLQAQEKEILLKFLHTVDIDSDDDDDHEDSISVCANCKHLPTSREDLILCSLCRITQYCSVSCQRKDSDFHRFSCGLVAKGSSAKEF